MSVTEHKQNFRTAIQCQIITVSDTRTKETDKSGKLIIELLEKQGHIICDYVIVKDDEPSIQAAVDHGLHHDQVEVIITNGGTGIAKRDVTIETVKNLLDKELVGFGEIFRMLSYTEDIGSAAILSRAIAGISHDKPIFSVPGSTGAVRLAMNRLILPELAHVLREAQKDL